MEQGQMRLESLLQDDRDRALTLLKKAFNPENRLPLEDLKKALDLDFVSKHLVDLTTDDVIEAAEYSSGNGRSTNGEKKSRVRFSDTDKTIIKDLVLSSIQQQADGKGITINEIVEVVHGEFPNAQPILVAGFLKDWEKDHKVWGNNSRPKLWFASKDAAEEEQASEAGDGIGNTDAEPKAAEGMKINKKKKH